MRVGSARQLAAAGELLRHVALPLLQPGGRLHAQAAGDAARPMGGGWAQPLPCCGAALPLRGRPAAALRTPRRPSTHRGLARCPALAGWLAGDGHGRALALLHDSVCQYLAAQLDGAWQSWTVTSDATSYDPTTRRVVPFARLNQYHTINGRLDFDEIAGKQVRLSLWVRNLTDEEYYTAGSDSSIAGGGRSLRLLGAPRTWGGELTYEF